MKFLVLAAASALATANQDGHWNKGDHWKQPQHWNKDEHWNKKGDWQPAKWSSWREEWKAPKYEEDHWRREDDWAPAPKHEEWVAPKREEWVAPKKEEWTPPKDSWQPEEHGDKSCEYKYRTTYLYECDKKEEGAKYYCANDGSYGGLCKFGYFKEDKSHPRAKHSKVYFKKVYHDNKFEQECKDTRHWDNWWHRRLLSGDAATPQSTEPMMSGKTYGGFRGYEPCPEHYDYGYETVLIKPHSSGDYHCYRVEGEQCDGLCDFKRAKECSYGEHGCKAAKRYYKVVFSDNDFKKDCEEASYQKNSWKREDDDWKAPSYKEEWSAPKKEEKREEWSAPKKEEKREEWSAPKKEEKREEWSAPKKEHREESWQAPAPPKQEWTY